MSSRNLSMTLPLEDDHHPSLEQLRAYHAGQLPASACHQLESHLLSCELCSDILEGMEQAAPIQTQQAVQELHHRLKRQLHKKKKKKWAVPDLGLDWKVAATLLLLLSSLGLILYSLFFQTKQEEEVIAYEPPLEAPSTDTLEIMAPLPRRRPQRLAARPKRFVPPTILGDTGLSPSEHSLLVEEIESGMASRSPDTAALALGNSPHSPEAVPVAVPTQESTVVPSALAGRVAGVATTSKQAKVTIRGAASFAPKTVKGKVVDATSGEPIPGVTVQVKGTSLAVATNGQGEFQLPATEQMSTLVVSFIGYSSKELQLAQNTADLQVKLQPDYRALSEVVVTGYGASRTKEEKPVAATPAQPATGEGNYRRYLKQHLRYPAAALPLKVKGKVVVGFTVNENGQLENLRVLKSLHPACDAEALRLIQEGPAWKPGQTHGQPVPQQVQISVRFKPPQ